jgi:hypothetical protein
MATKEEIEAKVRQQIFGEPSENATPSVNRPDLLQLKKELDDEIRKVNVSKAQRESDEVAWSEDDSVAAAERFFSSAALGYGDEIQLWYEAKKDSMFSNENYEDVHKRLREDYDLRQAEFQARQPGAYMAADIAGSIASPVNFIPGVNVAARLGMAGKTAKAFNTAGRVAAESAVYGSGEAGEGQRLEGAVSGAGAGLLGYGVLRGGMAAVGGTANLFTRRNIEGDLVDEMGNFTPITLVADKPTGSEGFLHTLYTDVIAPSFGGRGIISQQEKVAMEPLETLLKNKKKMSKDMSEGATKAKADVKKQFDAGSKALTKQFAAVRKNMEKEAADKTITPLEDKLKLLASKEDTSIFDKATAQENRINDALQHDFRNSAILESMPAVSTSKDVADVLSIPDIQGQMRALDNLWNQNGYKMIKDKKIRINVGNLETSFAKMIDSDDFFKVNAVDVPMFRNAITSSIEKVSKFRDKNNRIDGSKLAELRGDIGTKASAASDPQMRAALYKTQAQLDDLIRKELTPTQLKQFNAERAKYKSVVVLRDAVESTSKIKGAFTPEDWHKALDKNNLWDKRYGTGTLRKEADDIISQISASKQSIGRRSNKLAKAKALEIEKVIQDHRDKLAKRVEQLDIKERRVQLGREKDYEKAVEAAMNKPEINKITQEIEDLDNKLIELKQSRSSEKPSWFHALAAHSILGSVIGFGAGVGGAATGAIVVPAAAYGLGKGLASPTGQRILAGQTAPQMATQRLLQADATGRTADILARSIGRTGLLTGGQQ